MASAGDKPTPSPTSANITATNTPAVGPFSPAPTVVSNHGADATKVGLGTGVSFGLCFLIALIASAIQTWRLRKLKRQIEGLDKAAKSRDRYQDSPFQNRSWPARSMGFNAQEVEAEIPRQQHVVQELFGRERLNTDPVT